MSLEGGPVDQFTQDSVNRRLRPINHDYAVNNVPQIILLLKRNKLKITRSFSRENPPVMYLDYPNHIGNKWILLESDFIKIKEVAKKVDVRLFPHEREDVILNRILAYVLVEWP